MATTLADAFVRIRPDTRNLGPELKDQTDRAGSNAGSSSGRTFGDAFKGALKKAAIGLAVGAALAGAATGRFLLQSVEDASNLNETISKSANIFPQSQAKILAFANTAATSLGLSKQAALDGAASFGNFFNQIGIGEPEAAKMSTTLLQLSADLGSFNNADPSEVMNAFLSATRGEFDALQRFIPTVNAATVAAEALRFTHKKSVKDLTDADKAAALYRIALRDVGKASGDFARTSEGLANQQRIMRASFADIRAEIGTALLPVFTQVASIINGQIIPAIRALWAEHGPAVIAFLQDAATAVNAFMAGLQGQGPIDGFSGALNTLGLGIRAAIAAFREGDVTSDGFVGAMERAGVAVRGIVAAFRGDGGGSELGTSLKSATDSGRELLPVIQQFIAEMPSLSDVTTVAASVLGFLADHADTLAKIMPLLVGAVVAYKVAQLASNIAVAASPVFKILDVVATRQQTAAIRAQTVALGLNATATRGAAVAQVAETTAQNAGILARGRAVVSMVAHRVATVAVRAATLAWVPIQWLLNAALTANPIGLVVVAIALLIAGIVLAYRNSETFRQIVQAAWAGIKVAAEATVNWFVNVAWPFLRFVFSAIAQHVGDRIRFAIAVIRTIVAVVSIVRDAFERARAAIVERLTSAVEFVRALPGRIVGALGNLGGALFGAGRDLIQGFINGIRGQAGRVRDVLVGLLPGPLRQFAGVLGLASPSKLFERYGRETVEGYVLGVRRNAGRVDAAIASIAPSAPPATAAGAGRPGGDSGGPDTRDLLDVLRRIEALLAGLRLTVAGTDLALMVRKGERDLKYT